MDNILWLDCFEREIEDGINSVLYVSREGGKADVLDDRDEPNVSVAEIVLS